MEKKPTLTLENVSSNIMILIAERLHWRDLFALEHVCRRIRHILLRQFWRGCVPRLIFHSVKKPFGPLSVLQSWPDGDRQGHAVATKTKTRDIVRMLERCGPSLVELDLDVSRFAFYRRKEWWTCLDELDWKRVLDFRARHWLPVSVYRLSNALSKHCPTLRVLNLSHLALGGRAMRALAHGIGPQLVSLRLKRCFVNAHSDTCLDPSPEEWDTLLRAAQNLCHLDISENLHFGKKRPFGSLSRKLKTFRSDGAYLTSKQLTQVAQRAQQLHTLEVDDLFCLREDGTANESLDSDGEEVCSSYAFSSGKAHEILTLLSGLKVLWLKKQYFGWSSVETSSGTMAPLFRQASGTSLLKLLFPRQLSTATETSSSMLDKVYVTFEQFSSAQLAAFGRSTMANCTTLSFTLCDTLDDSALSQIAAMGRAQAMYRLEAVEQMTEELLALVQSTMDKRLERVSEQRPRRFEFIRHRPEMYCTARELADEVPRNAECAQTASQNMHPGVLFRSEDAEWRSETECDLSDKFIGFWGHTT